MTRFMTKINGGCKGRLGGAAAIFVLLIATGAVLADEFDLSWHTIDGGGSVSAGGDLTLAGAIGQPDANAVLMSGGGFELAGGFWPAAAPGAICTCPGDMTGDGLLDGEDVQQFVACLLNGGPACACADANSSGEVTPEDVSAFVTGLLSGGCP